MTKEELAVIKEMIQEAVGDKASKDTASKLETLNQKVVFALQEAQNEFENGEDDNVFWGKVQQFAAAYGDYKREEALQEVKGKKEAEGKKSSDKKGEDVKPSKEEVEKMKAIKDFAKRNESWYGKDDNLTKFANVLSAGMEDDPEWMYESPQAKLKHIEATVNKMRGESKQDSEVVELFGEKKEKSEETPQKLPPMVDFGSSVHGNPAEDKGKVALQREHFDMLTELGMGDEKTIRRFAQEMKRGA